MKGYQAIYVCRLCGERHSPEDPIETWGRAEVMASLSCKGYDDMDAPRMHEIHCCQDGSIGVAEFQGYQYKED